MRLGIVNHLGWAVVVVTDDEFAVVARSRIELVDPGLPTAPVHHHGGTWPSHDDRARTDDELVELVQQVRASVRTAVDRAFADLASGAAPGIDLVAVPTWPEDFPTAIATLRRPPYEARADTVMYRQELAAGAQRFGWRCHRFEARRVEREARALLGDRAGSVLDEPRTRLGPPWTVDHRTAVAGVVVAG